MFTRRWSLGVGLTAALVIALAVSSASANRLSLSQRAFGATWGAENLLGISELFGVTNRCQLTLSGSFHSTAITKTVGSLIGHINRGGFLFNCGSGYPMAVLTETLPWHVKYRRFTGALPNIVSIGISVIGMAFRMQLPTGVACLYRTETNHPAIFEIIRSESDIRPDETVLIPSTTPLCFDIVLSGPGNFTGPTISLI